MERRLIEVGLMDKSLAGREKIEKYIYSLTHTLYILVYFLSFWGCLLQKGGNSGSLTLH